MSGPGEKEVDIFNVIYLLISYSPDTDGVANLAIKLIIVVLEVNYTSLKSLVAERVESIKWTIDWIILTDYVLRSVRRRNTSSGSRKSLNCVKEPVYLYSLQRV